MMTAYVYTICVFVLFVVAADLEYESVKYQRFKYPSVRRDESILDDYYGIMIADPYRYLEDPTSEEVKKFIEEQNELTVDYLNRNSIKAQIEEKISEIYNYPTYGVPERYGSRYYSVMNNGQQIENVYYVQDSLNDEPRVLFDPNTLSTDDLSVNLGDITFSEDGELMSIGISSNGSDWMTVHFRNMSSGKEYAEILYDVKYSDIVWSKDGPPGIFYARYPKSDINSTESSLGTETYQYENQKLYYHRVGTSQTEDVLLMELDDAELIIGAFDITDDGKHLIIFPGKSDNSMVYLAPLEELQRAGGFTSKLKIIPIVERPDNEYYYIAAEGNTIYLQTNNGAPNYRVVAVNLNNLNPTNWSTLIPENDKNTLNNVIVVANDKIVLEYLVDVSSLLEVRSLIDGRLIQKIDTPPGSIDSIWGKKSHKELFFRVVSFLNPGIIYRVDLTHTPYKPEIIRNVTVPGFDASTFVTKQVFYPSYDGTLIPMFIVHKKNLMHNSSASTLLYGYGGFNVAVVAEFSPSRIVFLQHLDGVYALANIRGGGEYGSQWHDAGNLLNKQTAFDDFQAAAEYLIKENYTTASKMAITGESNGGLLVAACINQRPELYGAGVAEVGLHDLLRYQKFTIAYTWCEEYGCSDDGNQTIFENLRRISPLHNVRMPTDRNVQYPSVLLTTGDHDDRVVPLHSYKLIAELQYKIGREERQVSKIADTYVFLVESTGFVFNP